MIGEEIMTKIGNTDSWVLTCLHQYFTFIGWGGEVKMSSPHPDVVKAEHAHAATFSVLAEHGDVTPPPDVVEALNLISRMTWDIGHGKSIIVEKLPVQEDEEHKYTVTIKKKNSDCVT